MTEFHLSEQSSSLHHEPKVTEYLKCYKLPSPPSVRYGHIRFSSLQKKHRVELFGQAWLPDQSIGTILFIHGFSEHVGNYGQLIQDFVRERYAVASIDLRGHGLSDGPQGHVDNPSYYAEDIEQFAHIVFPHLTPKRPLYIWAHSMGGLIALQLLLRNKLPIIPAAVTLSSPLLGFPALQGKQKFLAKFAPVMAKVLPSLQIAHDLSPENLSKNTAYLENRSKDPLIGTHITPQWLISMKHTVAEIHNAALKFQKLSPTLCFLAGEEKITSLMEARKFAFHAYASLKHKVVEFPGMRHELEKELECHARILSESLAWFRSHN